jgi:hypothetical protein
LILSKTLIIRSTNAPIYEYVMCPKFSFIDYASNSGSVISIWFGVAVNDVYRIIKTFLKLKFYFVSKIGSILNLENISCFLMNDKCFSFITSFNIFISMFDLKIRKIEWRFLFKLVCLSNYWPHIWILTLQNIGWNWVHKLWKFE